jgi:aspartate/tyrosine/aromatic aminotransferase
MGNRKSLVKFNKQKVVNMVKKAFKETTQQYFEECQKVIKDPNAFTQFPNQDIVDTGALRDSGKIIAKQGNYKAIWTMDYAVYVHEGYTKRNGGIQPARPWTELARDRMNFDEVLGSKLDGILKKK